LSNARDENDARREWFKLRFELPDSGCALVAARARRRLITRMSSPRSLMTAQQATSSMKPKIPSRVLP
jgi:hypothetical protein